MGATMRAKQELSPEEVMPRKASWFRRLNAKWPWLKFGVAFWAIFAVVFFSAKMFWPVGDSSARGVTINGLGTRAPKVVLSSEAWAEKVKGKKLVALTFDDGPSKATTPRLLEVLAEKQAHATFFMVGNNMLANPEIVRKVAEGGHEIGGHTVGHNYLTDLSTGQVKANNAQMEEIFRDILGEKMGIMRPPGGFVDARTRAAVGMPIIYWSVDTKDWRDRNAKIVRERAVAEAKDGAIILMHDIHATTVDAVAGIIDDLRARGYEFVTISELALIKKVKMNSGTVYYSF